MNIKVDVAGIAGVVVKVEKVVFTEAAVAGVVVVEETS